MQHKEFHVKQDWQLKEQAGAELGQAHLPTGILLYCDQHLLPNID